MATFLQNVEKTISLEICYKWQENANYETEYSEYLELVQVCLRENRTPVGYHLAQGAEAPIPFTML